ncbi:MAG: outer membrane protein assembly factor BamD [Candidatus Acidiferrales bacterium]
MLRRIARFLLKNRRLLAAVLGVSLAGSVCASAYGQKIYKSKKKQAAQDDTSASAEPDKVLYERAMHDFQRRQFIEARLNFQTLINTYPDSEYLAKAKLGIADSYYKEGGNSNLTEAIAEYNDFGTFFPFLDEAAYAQMQVAMAHYRMMEKPDRDTTEAQQAESSFQAFLLKYPQSPLVPQAEQHLRDVQETLASGEYKIAHFYYVKRDYPASAARLVELSERYPLYSQSDEALWTLGDIYMRAKQVSKNEDDKNHWADLAGLCYGRIVQDYPLSGHAGDAKSRLKAMGMPVPAADPDALARMKREQMYEKEHGQHAALLRSPLKIFNSGPNVSTAAHGGEPNLNPPDEAVSATDVLKQGAAGPTFEVAVRPAATEDANGSSEGDTSPPVEAVPSDSSNGAPVTGAAAEIIAAPTSTDSSTPSTSPAAPAGPAASNVAASEGAPSAASPIAPSGNGAVAAGSTPAQPGAAQVAQGATGSSTSPATGPQKAAKANSKTESTSKKKKGVHKLIPW